MLTRSKCKKTLSPGSVALMFLLMALPLARAGEEMPVAEVLALIPKSIDMDDNLEIANYEKLVALGPSIYGALLEIVRTHPDTLVASRALSVLCDARGDKRKVIAELGKVLEEKQFLTGHKNELMLMVLAKAISDMGEGNDKQLLLPLFAHPSEDVREVARHFTDMLEKKAANLPTSPAEESSGTSSNVACAEETHALAVLPCTQAGESMSAEEVWELLPKGADIEAPREISNYMVLVEQGDSIYGALLDIVRQNDSPLIAGTALSVLRASKGDKREVVEELGKVINERLGKTGRMNDVMLVLLAESITDMGDSRDKRLLVPLLSHPSEAVRHAGHYCMDNLTGKTISIGTPPAEVPTAPTTDHDNFEQEPPPIP